MKLFKKIIQVLCMVLITICGLCAIILLSAKLALNSKSITYSLERVNYYNSAKQSIEKEFSEYISSSKTDKIINSVSVTSQIKEIVDAFANNTMQSKSYEIQTKMENVIYENIKDDSNNEQNIKELSNMLSARYVKLIFPTTELTYASSVLQRYSQKIIICIIVLMLIVLISFCWLYKDGKSIKWGLIGIYNIVWLLIVVCILLLNSKNIVIGSQKTNLIIHELINNINFNMFVSIVVALIITIPFNYKMYFKKRKKKHEGV